jgi:hypothetical protein
VRSAAARAALSVSLLVLAGVAPPSFDSQYVLRRYGVAIAAVAAPKVVVYSYTISQVGPVNIEQRHRIYRSGTAVRDETLSVDGIPLVRKMVRFSHRDDPYTLARFAPPPDTYELLFVGTAKDGHHLDYVYDATPLNRSLAAYVDRLTIDGVNFLPRAVHFHTSALDADGSGEIDFGPFGKYWMPTIAVAQAHVKGKPARERIVWSDYRFPASLPPSTFQPPEPLPEATPAPL